jgi:geranylgeranyl diphosphate synthase type II
MDASLETNMQEKQRLVEKALERCLPSGPETPEALADAMRYAVIPGGKRLRPVLCLAACEACGGDPAGAIAPACAVELVHAFSLVHDDLPAMDDDDMRRGRPTLHKAAGEAIAILAGDALLSLAFGVVAEDGALGDAQKVAVLQELTWAGGHSALAGGQVLDLEAEGKGATAEELEQIHAKKTAALITASVVMGGIAAGAQRQQLDALRTYGHHFGMAFQIVDDVLDVVGDEATLGKKVGADAAHEKATAVAVHGLDKARALAAEHVDKALGALEPFGEWAALLGAIAREMLARQR